MPSLAESKASLAAASPDLDAPTRRHTKHTARTRKGRRGRKRAGYYLALLHTLELHYRLEHQVKKSPLHWQPLPRQRPDQFMNWLLEDLELLGGPPPVSLAELLEHLQDEQLTHVADGLRTVVERKLLDAHPDAAARAQLRELSLEELEARLGGPVKGEKHPQARKFARIVSRNLDRAWREALILTASEHERESGGRPSVFLLGALPPSFRVINAHTFAHLEDTDLPAEPAALTVLQFYGLATGTLPPAPAPWREGLEALVGLDDEELALLGSLSGQQVEHIRTLDEGIVERLRHSHSERNLGLVSGVDEEVARMVKRKKLTPRLIKRLQDWSAPQRQTVHALLGEQALWVTAYLQDWALLTELFAARTPARLHLRDLFPESITWLDGHLTRHFEDATLHDVSDLEASASAISQRIQQHLLRRAGMERVQSSQQSNQDTWEKP